MNRPTSVNVVCWIVIVLNVLALIGLGVTVSMLHSPQIQDALAKSPFPIWVQLGMSGLAPLLMIAAAWFMRKGRNWGRILYLGWNIFAFGLALATQPLSPIMIPGVALFCLMAIFLVLPGANAFFSSQR